MAAAARSPTRELDQQQLATAEGGEIDQAGTVDLGQFQDGQEFALPDQVLGGGKGHGGEEENRNHGRVEFSSLRCGTDAVVFPRRSSCPPPPMVSLHRLPAGILFAFCTFLPLPAQQKSTNTLPPGGYLSADDILAHCGELAGKDGVTVRELARSAEDRPLLLLGFGERGGVGRQAVLVVADPDGTRPVASQVAWGLAQELAAGSSPLLEAATVYLVPVANPDASAHLLADGFAWRGAPVDEDHDARSDEDPPDDLDGDGLVLKMRIPDPAGDWLADPNDDRAMRRADPAHGDRPTSRLLDEGLDEDGDRAFNEDGPGGVRLEANWPHRWREHEPAAGPYPLSEPLNRALADFVLERPNIAVVLVFGAEDGLARPAEGVAEPGPDSTEPPKEDADLIRLLAERLYPEAKDGEQGPPRTKPRSAPHGSGGFADWARFQAGRLVLESALWSPPAGEGDEPTEADLLAWNDAAYGGAGFVSWRPFDHPQLGPVEIGGWKPLVRDNPPVERIPALTETWAGFLASLADDFARLEWSGIEVHDLGEGVCEARATLVNTGLLPTVTEMGRRTGRLPRIRIELQLPEGGVLLGGRDRLFAERLAGLGGHQEFRWLYRLPLGSGPARIHAESLTAGSVDAALEVE
ncbi:MAG: hypothetical protein D6702_00880 [Planctomycetota bacterium]|nr:MAG: hypothetical protein D6702_00880 [Planctomycetota bacterium]